MGEVVRVDFGGSGTRVSMPELASPSVETELKLHELSEATLISTAITREIRFRKASQQVVARKTTLEEFSAALDGVMTIGCYLTEEQQTAVYVFAQAACESQLAAPSEEGE